MGLGCGESKKGEKGGRKWFVCLFLIFQQESIAGGRQGEYDPEIEIIHVLST